MTYLVVKWVHILSAVLLFGTGLGSAFYKFMADRNGSLEAIALTNRHVVLADWIFTTPTVLLQPATGMAMVYLAGYAATMSWIRWSLGLFIVAGLCWLPVVVLQIRMRDLANAALKSGVALNEEYWRLGRIWFWLGVPAFIAIMVVFILMVHKPG